MYTHIISIFKRVHATQYIGLVFVKPNRNYDPDFVFMEYHTHIHTIHVDSTILLF